MKFLTHGVCTVLKVQSGGKKRSITLEMNVFLIRDKMMTEKQVSR